MTADDLAEVISTREVKRTFVVLIWVLITNGIIKKDELVTLLDEMAPKA